VKYIERQGGVYLPRIGRDEDSVSIWSRRRSHDPGGVTCTQATVEYLRLHGNKPPTLSFSKQVGRFGVQRLRGKEGNVELGSIQAYAKGGDDDMLHAEGHGHGHEQGNGNVGPVDPLKEYRYDDVQKNVQDLEVEIKERMQRVNLLLPKKPKPKPKPKS
jgi:hypothetical protein